MAGYVYPLGKRAKLIGTPYTGTHAKAFNIAGGSDNWESENAIDLATPIGTHIIAIADGVIGPEIGSLGQGGRFAGLRLHLVTHDNEWYYAHASKLYVRAGQAVRQGQIIGASGEANGVAHLHIASRDGNPLKALQHAQVMDGVSHSRVAAGTKSAGPQSTHEQNVLLRYDRVYPVNSPEEIPQSDVVAIHRAVGFPATVAILFGHVAYAESALKPGTVNSIGATGLDQVYNHPELVARFGNMRNPFNNAKAAYVLWRQGGMAPWLASRYAGNGGGWAKYATGHNVTPRGPAQPVKNPLSGAVLAPGVPTHIGVFSVVPGPTDNRHDYHAKVAAAGRSLTENARHTLGHAQAIRGLMRSRFLPR